VKILIDECVPKQIRGFLGSHDSITARQAGLGGYKNGRLLNAADGTYDVLITSDKNLRYQQHLTGRKLAILLLSTNDREVIEQNGERILKAVNRMKPREFMELELPAATPF
jgi:predicted nuclease of predicted toxin-antitoxin system